MYVSFREFSVHPPPPSPATRCSFFFFSAPPNGSFQDPLLPRPLVARRRRPLAPKATDALGAAELLLLAADGLGVLFGEAPPLAVELFLLELAPLLALALLGPRHAAREPLLARPVVLGLRRVRRHARVHGQRQLPAGKGYRKRVLLGALGKGCF